jgi:uncharacterized protein (TIGR03435 family)
MLVTEWNGSSIALRPRVCRARLACARKGDTSDLTLSAAFRVYTGSQRAMLRNLLEDRFGLRVRRETREVPVYLLTRLDERGALGPNLRRAAKDCLPRTACEGRTNGADSSYRGAQWSIVLQTIGAGLDGRLMDRSNPPRRR